MSARQIQLPHPGGSAQKDTSRARNSSRSEQVSSLFRLEPHLYDFAFRFVAERISFARQTVLGGSHRHLRRPPPPRRPPPLRRPPPPPRKPPPPRLMRPRDPLLEKPRLLLVRALGRLNPLEAPPMEFRLPAPPRERFRPPARAAAPAPMPAPPARLALPTPPARLPRPEFPLKPAAGLLFSFPPCRAICCRALAWRCVRESPRALPPNLLAVPLSE